MWTGVKKLFSFKTNNSKYSIEIYSYILCIAIFLMFALLDYIIDNQFGYDLVGLRFVYAGIFLWQTYAFISRMIDVFSINKDLKIINGKYKFKSNSIKINYKDLKKFLSNTIISIKFYCVDSENENHIIEVHVYTNKQSTAIKRKYYFDKNEFELTKILMLINEKNMINNSQITIIDNSIYKKNMLNILHIC